jgi:hypothetical protein
MFFGQFPKIEREFWRVFLLAVWPFFHLALASTLRSFLKPMRRTLPII